MPFRPENFALDFFMDSFDSFNTLFKHILIGAKPIYGYYGIPYWNHHYGDVQMVFHADKQGDTQVSDLASHAAGKTEWEVLLYEPDLNQKGKDRLARNAIVTRSDGTSGMAVVSIVNADVLPSYVKKDRIKLQVIALPFLIGYYSDENECRQNANSFCPGGKLLEDGVIFPIGLVVNRVPVSSKMPKDIRNEEVNVVRGTVKHVEGGTFILEEDEYHPYIVCEIDTQFGPLEIIHAPDQVDEALRDNIREGATVLFYGMISGDAAIGEYADGIVRDEEHDLAALRYVFAGGDPERLRSIMTENTVYLAEHNNRTFTGTAEIIERIKYVQKKREEESYVHLATISAVDASEDPPDYSVGKRCIGIASGSVLFYESVVFIDVDEDGNILRLVASKDSRYKFTVDETPNITKPLLADTGFSDNIIDFLLTL